MESSEVAIKAYQDINHPSNKIRPRLRCWGCGKLGCVGRHWGQWCFKCNVARIDRITASLNNMVSLETYRRNLAELPEPTKDGV